VQKRLAKPSKVENLGVGSSHGVDLSKFVPLNEQATELKMELGFDADTPIIGFVGRYCPDKGSRLIEQLHEILTLDGVPHQVLIVGPVEGRPRDSGATLGFKSRMVFTGPVDDTSIYYQVMDLLILPTMREGFPNVVLEASASGIAVIASDATGSIDSVINGHTGLVFEKNKIDSLVSASKTLLERPNLRVALGVNGRKWVAKHFDQKEVTLKQVNFYTSKLLESSGEAP
jgi:glycosyltransferase involved in cell wall biosynthesis